MQNDDQHISVAESPAALRQSWADFHRQGFTDFAVKHSASHSEAKILAADAVAATVSTSTAETADDFISEVVEAIRARIKTVQVQRGLDWLWKHLTNMNSPLVAHLKETPACYDSLSVHLRKAANRGECSATTERLFLKWCQRTVEKEINKAFIFRIAGEDLTVADVKRLALMYKPVRKGTPPFPTYTVKNGIAYVDIKGKILKVPAEWGDNPVTNFLPILQLLWPFSLRGGKAYKSSTTEDFTTGKWSPRDLPLHHVFMWFKYHDVSADLTKARNKDYLDWTGDNLFVPALDDEGTPISSIMREFRVKQALKESAWKYVSAGEGQFDKKQAVDPELQQIWEHKLQESTSLRQTYQDKAETESARYDDTVGAKERAKEVPEDKNDYEERYNRRGEDAPIDLLDVIDIKPDNWGNKA